MAASNSVLVFRRLRKALKVLSEKGPMELFRLTQTYLKRRGQINLASKPGQTLVYDTTSVQFSGKKFDQATLLKTLEELRTQPFVLALSQDDYLHVVGGVQLKMADQQHDMNEKGLRYLHISPFLVRPTLDFSHQPGVMRLNLDGHFLGFADDDTLLGVLSSLVEEDTLNSIQLHHLMGWKPDYVPRMLSVAGDVPIYFWLHDFFSICPNYPLLRNDREYCHAPDPVSNACQLCTYGTIRPLHYQAFNDLFQRFQIQAVAPSEFALELWRQKFPTFSGVGQVMPNAHLEWGERLQETNSDQALKIAFVGYPVFHKGWQTWLNLTEKFGKDPRYRFYHFSSDWQPSSNFEKVSVEVTNSNRTAMTDALREKKIDIAFLWSICPETFSFTLYESLAAGCYVITNPASGNIQDVIKKDTQLGMVYPTETEMLAAFDSADLIETNIYFRKNVRRYASLGFAENGTETARGDY